MSTNPALAKRLAAVAAMLLAVSPVLWSIQSAEGA